MAFVEGIAARNTGLASELSYANARPNGESCDAALGSRDDRRKRERLKALIVQLFTGRVEAASVDLAARPQPAPLDSAQGRIYPLVIAARRAARHRAPQGQI